MPATNNGLLSEASLPTIDEQSSVQSGDQSSQALFNKSVAPAPSHTASKTWKSGHMRDKEEYERVKQRVRHIAPEQFKDKARPNGTPSEIFPRNANEWRQHKAEIAAMAAAEREKSAKLLTDQVKVMKYIPKAQRNINSEFGGHGKIFNDGLGPVLALPTIWSAEYKETIADWPLAAELKWNGDNRESKLARTKVGRFLPPPREPSQSTIAWHDQQFMRQQPLDETGPVYTNGPFPSAVHIENQKMDNDPAFEEQGQVYLHLAELREDLGEKVAAESIWERLGTVLPGRHACMEHGLKDQFSGTIQAGEIGMQANIVGYAGREEQEDFEALKEHFRRSQNQI
jgi:hypothetical protein